MHFTAYSVICTQAKHKQIPSCQKGVILSSWSMRATPPQCPPTRRENICTLKTFWQKKESYHRIAKCSLSEPLKRFTNDLFFPKSEDELCTNSPIPPEQRALYCISCLLAPVRIRDLMPLLSRRGPERHNLVLSPSGLRSVGVTGLFLSTLQTAN